MGNLHAGMKSVPMASHKICTKCGEDKLLSEYCKHKITRDGLKHWCKDCSRQHTDAWKAANPDRVRAYSRRHYVANRERLLEYRHSRNAQYYRENRDAVLAKRRSYCAQHIEEVATYNKQYLNTVAGKAAAARGSAKRRMRMLQTAAAVALTAEEWRARIAEYDSHCCWCGKELAEDEIVMDHIVALANGGAHIASNVAPSCWDCNASKHTRDWGYPYPGLPRDDTQPEVGSEWL